VSFYCRPALEAAIEKQAAAELDSKSAIMSGILQNNYLFYELFRMT